MLSDKRKAVTNWWVYRVIRFKWQNSVNNVEGSFCLRSINDWLLHIMFDARNFVFSKCARGSRGIINHKVMLSLICVPSLVTTTSDKPCYQQNISCHCKNPRLNTRPPCSASVSNQQLSDRWSAAQWRAAPRRGF